MNDELIRNRHFYWALNLSGESFIPSELSKKLEIPFYSFNDVGDIGKRGRFKNLPIPFGHAIIKAPDNLSHNEKTDFLLNILESEHELIKSFGVTEIELDHAYFYESQVNLGYEPKFLRRIGQLNIPFSISCYQIDSMDDLPELYLIE